MTQNNEREAFEAWGKLDKFQARRTECGTSYHDPIVAGGWSGWQAATQASESEINSLKERVGELEAANSCLVRINVSLAKESEELTASNNRLREALERMIESYQYEASSENQSLLNAFKVLESTPAQSLAEHDNEVTASYKKALEFAEHMAKSTEQFMIAINQLDEADQEEDEETVEIMQEKRGEHWRAVNSSIYEFRQRSDRALKASHG